MPEIARVKVNWTGFAGAPGYTNLYFAASGGGGMSQAVADNAISRADTFLNVWQSKLPPSVSYICDPTVEAINDSNGQLGQFFNTAPFQRGNGSGTGNYSAASGAVVNWYTDGVRNGRRVRGRSFMVPFAGSALGSNGTLDDASLPALRAAATALATPGANAARLIVWCRPTAPAATDGISFDVTSATIPDKVAVLRSRRD
jgi:hypothetical protein